LRLCYHPRVMYVISSRRRWLSAGGNWTVLRTGNASPPTTSPPQSNYLPSGFINSLQDPLVILIHGYASPETPTFKQYATEIGTSTSPGLMAANGFQGSVIGYDWPSFDTPASGPLQQYVGDLNAARNVGAPALADFLGRLTAALAGRNVRINLMAHSMGNFVLRETLLDNPDLAGTLDNIVSFAPDLPQADLLRPDVTAIGDALSGNWFVYWAQADFVLMTLSNLANIILGHEQWGGQRLGQQGPPDDGAISAKVVAQNWDMPLAQDLGSTYNCDLREWPFSAKIHSLYWSDKPFLQNVAANLQRTPRSAPTLANWPAPECP
jgi:pimeloyl-ACP methyl ester carboxylesterase